MAPKDELSCFSNIYKVSSTQTVRPIDFEQSMLPIFDDRKTTIFTKSL